MKALVLTGGLGRKFVPFSATRPKALTVVGGDFLLRRTLTQLREVGITDITIVVGPTGQKIKSTIAEGSELGVRLRYIDQGAQHGIGHALARARDCFAPGENFLLLYGDIVTAANPVPQILQAFNSFKGPVASVCLPGPPTGRYGNVYLSGMRITKLIEKPSSENLGNYVLAGIFILPSEVFSFLDKHSANMEGVFGELINGPGLGASIWEEGWIDVERPWDILAANQMLMDSWTESRISKDATIEGNISLSGPVCIEAGSVIRSGAVLAGPCYIGPDCYIGNNVLIRKYASVGACSTIGYGVELKNCVLFRHSDIGRLSFVGDSVIGENVDIGSGAMTINENLDRSPVDVKIDDEVITTGFSKLGAFIGDDVKIGAGNTIAAGSILKHGSVISHHATLGTVE